MTVTIEPAQTAADYAAFGDLIEEYEAWLHERYASIPGFIDIAHQHQNMDAERLALPTKFGPPNGLTLLARVDGDVTGAVAYRDLGGHVCEMKRMYVRPSAHGQGVGRQLCEALIAHATDAGFVMMRLDTGFLNTEAMALYESLGFTPCGPYAYNPPEMLPHLRYFERALT